MLFADLGRQGSPLQTSLPQSCSSLCPTGVRTPDFGGVHALTGDTSTHLSLAGAHLATDSLQNTHKHTLTEMKQHFNIIMHNLLTPFLMFISPLFQ